VRWRRQLERAAFTRHITPRQRSLWQSGGLRVCGAGVQAGRRAGDKSEVPQLDVVRRWWPIRGVKLGGLQHRREGRRTGRRRQARVRRR
jgi:hypothetical protein